MAKIKFGMMMTDARGKLGGQVFSKNRGGAYVRTKVTPVNPQSVFQSAVRASFATFSQAWSGLTQELRDSWNGAVSSWATTDIFGDLRNPTGKNLFLRLNQLATQAGWASFTTVPVKAEVPEGIVASAIFNLADETLTLEGVSNALDVRIVLRATPPLSQGTSFVKNDLRDIYNDDAASYSSGAAFYFYTGRFGNPIVGNNIHIAVKYVLASGQSSPEQIVKASVI